MADSLLVKCSLNGEDPYWGRVVERAGLRRGRLRHRPGLTIAYGGVGVCRGGVAAAHDEAPWPRTWPGATSRSAASSGWATGRAAVLGAELGYGYIDENRTTS